MASLLWLMSGYAQAGFVTMPPVEGYSFFSSTFPSASSAGSYFCNYVSANYSFSRAVPTGAGDPLHPQVKFYCRDNRTGSETTSDSWWSNWLRTCSLQGYTLSPGTVSSYAIPQTCIATVPQNPIKSPPSNCNKGSTPSVGNPIEVGQTVKYQVESDFSSDSLRFSRFYNGYVAVFDTPSSSIGTQFPTLGGGWWHDYMRSIYPSDSLAQPDAMRVTRNESTRLGRLPLPSRTPAGMSIDYVYLERQDGSAQYFLRGSDGSYAADSDIADSVKDLFDSSGNRRGWQYRSAQKDEVEEYDLYGQLLSITQRNGYALTLVYSDGTSANVVLDKTGVKTTTPLPSGLLVSIQDIYGKRMSLEYGNGNRIVKVVDPAAGVYLYNYDALGLLSAVSYPDGTSRSYLYHEPAYIASASGTYQMALTGIVDENGARLATFKYDMSGRAISTEYWADSSGVNSANKFTVTANRNFPYNIDVVDPLGATRSYLYQTVAGVQRLTSQSQPGGSGCGATTAHLTYDANGNVATHTDFNGNTTAYSYDLSRNLETKRVEAQGKPEQRTISTTWHPTYRLQTGVAEPNKITTFSYDASGNLLSKSEQATTDTNDSQGFNAGAVGSVRTWSWTYTTYGRKTSATDPLGNVTTYTYFSDTDASLGNRGNLASITNPLGQTTRITAYDGNSRPLSISDANGVITQLTYSPRGWLTSRNVGGETTAYTYDGVGQPTLVTAPDGSTTSYTYDGAHRLTGIADSLGNRITYTLDAMGNRIGEDVTDPSGQLAQTLTRNYDALGRLQSLVGVGHE